MNSRRRLKILNSLLPTSEMLKEKNSKKSSLKLLTTHLLEKNSNLFTLMIRNVLLHLELTSYPLLSFSENLTTPHLSSMEASKPPPSLIGLLDIQFLLSSNLLKNILNQSLDKRNKPSSYSEAKVTMNMITLKDSSKLPSILKEIFSLLFLTLKTEFNLN